MLQLLEQIAQFPHAPNEPIKSQRRLLRFTIGFGGAGHLIPSTALGEIQRAVGRGKHRFQIGFTRLHRRDTNRQRHADGAFTSFANREPVRGHQFTQPFGKLSGFR